MNKLRLLLFSGLFSLCSYGQITIIGHNKLNNIPITNTSVFVKEKGVITKTLTTGKTSDFMIHLEYGKNYQIFFQNTKSTPMFMEILASDVPEEKRAYKMVHELNVPFYDKTDEDIDTTLLREAFQKIVFDGKNKMVNDSNYSNSFAARIIKFHQPSETRSIGGAMEKQVTIAGKVLLNNDQKLTINNKRVELIDKKGQVIKSTFTNRFGAFSFTGVMPASFNKIKVDLRENEIISSYFTLVTSKNNLVATTKAENGICTWTLTPEESSYLVDDNYSINIGGKLIVSSARQKKFFANKTVYLSNRLNTVIKKTTTNVLGTFVFENLKPDNTYFIGIDKSELKPGEKTDLLNKDEKFISTLDTLASGRMALKVISNYNKKFNDISISDAEMTMSIKATIYGDNTNNPIGKLKVIMLNDSYQVIDSAITDDFGAFRFKYLPFLKRFYLSAENNENMLDGFSNILIYNKDYNLVKIMTHEKGTKFSYKPVNAEMFRLREVEIEDPWLEFIGNKKLTASKKLIVENIFFESDKYVVGDQAKEILNKVVLVMKTNNKIKIEIGAHTDSKGSDEDNLKLSASRAKTVMDYLVAAGVNSGRLLCKGYGETELLNDCGNNKPCTEMEHAKNRRIEFKIVEE